MPRALLLLFLFSPFFRGVAHAQSTLHTVKLHPRGDQTALPLIQLGATEALELHFDDFDTRSKNFFYSYVLCNWDWSRSELHPYEYTRGFTNVRLSNYRNSSIAGARYVHYQALLPDRSSYPTRSGNYLLRIFLDGDTSKTVYTRRFVVVDAKAQVGATLQQPFGALAYETHHKLQVGVRTDARIQVYSPQDLKVVILQNGNWQTSTAIDRPTVYRGNYYEYLDEPLTMLPAGREWRWLDMRSLRLRSDRMLDLQKSRDTVRVALVPDRSRQGVQPRLYRDLNGAYNVETLESVNPLWQADYAWVRFTYEPPSGRELPREDVFLFGELTGWSEGGRGKMTYNPDAGVYTYDAFLKQGYYSYMYATRPRDRVGPLSLMSTEGSWFGTENAYTVLVYYRPFGARADELIGWSTMNTQGRN